jgi:hypothetical protein
MDENTGFTEAEALINARLIEVINRFRQLPITHPADLPEVFQAIHRIQYVLGTRILRREHPDVFVTILPKPVTQTPSEKAVDLGIKQDPLPEEQG